MAPRVRTLPALLAFLALSALAAGRVDALPSNPATVTILHGNDFHGQLEPSGSNPGLARVATTVKTVRAAVGAANMLLLDAGDAMQGSLLSNIWQGMPVIDAYNLMGYGAAALGNHDFDWGQDVLSTRVKEAGHPYLSANVVVNDTGDCATAGWTRPDFVDAPYRIFPLGTAPNTVRVGVIGVTTVETPTITVAAATAGLCFKDPAASILHHYDAMRAEADVIVVLSHLGFTDGGYGYGLPVYGDQTLARKLIDAGKPAHLIIGGHSHTNLAAATMIGSTAVVQAYYNGRALGRASVTVQPSGAVSVAWARLAIGVGDTPNAEVNALVTAYASDPSYLALINTPVGYAQVDLLRNYNGDGMMGAFIDDAIYNQLNGDTEPLNDVDVFFNNPGGLRSDWCDKEDPLGSGNWVWSSSAADCSAEGLWGHPPMLLTYGQMFYVLPFGNATVVGDMKGAQILELINQSATLFKGAIQPAGLRYGFFRYADALPGPQPWAWGGYDVCVRNRGTGACEPLDLDRTYRVGTNEFLAPAGQDGFVPFKYLTNITYWGDMLDAVNARVSAQFGSSATAYRGPDGDGTLDGRIARDGDRDDVYEAGEIVPVTVLHHNDAHGNLVKGAYVGYSQLAIKITDERAHNPSRTLLLNAGDSFQGDAMMYHFRSAALGHAADGTPLPPELRINPLLKAFNFMGYDAMTLGNHEFNFGRDVFTSSLALAEFPVLQANLEDDGRYGIDKVPVQDHVAKLVGPEHIRVAILGIGNHRVPAYELPTNIAGLTFTDPIDKARDLAEALGRDNDVVLALTHIGFTDNPASAEVDTRVDTAMAANVPGLDLIVGGHSHTNPANGFGAYKFLPTIVGGPGNTPVLVTQAYRYNNTLGEVSLGLRPDGRGGHALVSRAGRYISIASSDPEDAAVKNLALPYVDLLNAYTSEVIGQTTVPIDALQAFTQETSGANLQADAAVHELETLNGIAVDFHLAGAMSNRKVPASPSAVFPYALTVNDMFSLMPYENSLVVLRMNGPQLRAVLERAYRNYYYYKYVPGYGGYSYYTTCMIDVDAGARITYNDLGDAPYDPARNYVVSLTVDGQEVDFDDPDTYYRVSTVNYLAAGSCNFNDDGASLWPLDQIVADTQLYVRDAAIHYVQALGTVSPAVEGRLQFVYDLSPPVISVAAPTASTYLHPASLTLDFSAVDVGPAGLKEVSANLDGAFAFDGQVVDLLTLSLGDHTLAVYAEDRGGNGASASVTFTVTATPASLISTVRRFSSERKITGKGIANSLLQKLRQAGKQIARHKTGAAIRQLKAFIREVKALRGKRIKRPAAATLIADAQWVISHL